MLSDLERSLYKSYLPDREMRRYRLPRSLDKVVLYPYSNGKRITASELEKAFPSTWAYLVQHQKTLKSRGAVTKSSNPWWSPVRPRSPETILRPKLVTPHLTILPRFSLDTAGSVLVSHSPFMILKDPTDEQTQLRFFLV